MSDAVRYELIDSNIALVTINRPQARNAVNADVARAIEEIVERTNADPAIHVCIITGEGQDAFCAGADLKTVAAGEVASLRTSKGGFGGFVFAQREKIWIAAINGFALGGGCEIALACDMAIADPSAQIGLPEVRRGVMALAGGLVRLPRSIPRAIALEAISTGNPFSAERAYQLGLINHVSAPGKVVERAIALARDITRNSPIAVRESVRIARNDSELTEVELIELGMRARADLEKTEDYAEGLRAFVEKRPPKWRGC